MRTLVTAALLHASDGGFGAGRPERLVIADWLRQESILCVSALEAGMPFLIGSSLSRGHERSSPDAAVSKLRSPIALFGTILFVALALLGMSSPASAAVTYFTTASYSAAGEVSEVDGTTLNKTDINVQNSVSNSTSGKSSSVSLLLNNKQATVGGATADASARVHAGIGALGVEAFASAAGSTHTAEAGSA